MNSDHIRTARIFNRDINPETVIAILPYRPPYDLGEERLEDFNATLLLRRRPFRVHARRGVVLLAETLGFHILPMQQPIALNPAYHAIAGNKGDAPTLVLARRGEKHIIRVDAALSEIRDALDHPLLPSPVGSRLQNEPRRAPKLA